MILLIFIIMVGLGTAINEGWIRVDWNRNWVETTCYGFLILGWIGTIISLIIIILTAAFVPSTIASNQVRYETLVYQVENKLYDDYSSGDSIAVSNLIAAVQDWNEGLASGKAAQRNFWVGIFIPNIYDQFEYVPLPGQLDKEE